MYQGWLFVSNDVWNVVKNRYLRSPCSFLFIEQRGQSDYSRRTWYDLSTGCKRPARVNFLFNPKIVQLTFPAAFLMSSVWYLLGLIGAVMSDDEQAGHVEMETETRKEESKHPPIRHQSAKMSAKAAAVPGMSKKEMDAIRRYLAEQTAAEEGDTDEGDAEAANGDTEDMEDEQPKPIKKQKPKTEQKKKKKEKKQSEEEEEGDAEKPKAKPKPKAKRKGENKNWEHKPVGARTAFSFFTSKERNDPKVAGMTFGERSKRNSEIWAAMTDEDKTDYKLQQVKDKKRFQREEAAWIENYPDEHARFEAAKAAKKGKKRRAAEGEQEEEEEGGDETGQPAKKKRKVGSKKASKATAVAGKDEKKKKKKATEKNGPVVKQKRGSKKKNAGNAKRLKAMYDEIGHSTDEEAEGEAEGEEGQDQEPDPEVEGGPEAEEPAAEGGSDEQDPEAEGEAQELEAETEAGAEAE